MNAVVKSIKPNSPAGRTIIALGDTLRRINGHAIRDILDYMFFSNDALLLIELTGADGLMKLVRIRKPEGADIGLEFFEQLMDKQRSCVNKCVFCFIDQLPKGMRETLYIKDDDLRLSFLQGNYVTLTNISEHDVERIIKMHISPINVSVHTLDPDLRSYMLGTGRGADGIVMLEKLARAGIILNCQIVCCPGINDGRVLSHTIKGLIKMGKAINSVSIVPVGLTKHRKGIPKLIPFDPKLAGRTIRQVGRYGEKCLSSYGSRKFYCADELFILSGTKLPPNAYYEGYPQLENGVGMMRLFIREFIEALLQAIQIRQEGMESLENETAKAPSFQNECENSLYPFSIATGVAASGYLTNLLKIAADKYDKIACVVYAIRNDYFGDSVTVSGLVTGSDIIAQLKSKNLGSKLLIPQNMLKSGEDVFLDNLTVEDVSQKLGVPIRIVGQNGADFFRAIYDSRIRTDACSID